MGGSTGRGAYWSCAKSTRPLPQGRDGNSSACDAKNKRRCTGWGAARAGNRTCLRTGKWASRPMLRCKSRMRRESHVRFREGAGVKCPRATRLVVLCGTAKACEEAEARVGKILDRPGLQ